MSKPITEGEYILAYEILYNLYLKNINIIDIVEFIDENYYDVSYESLEEFFCYENKDISEYKLLCLWTALTLYSIEYRNSIDIPVAISFNSDMKIEDLRQGIDSIFSEELGTPISLGNLIEYYKENDYLSSGISLLDSASYRIYGKYNYFQADSRNTLRNEMDALAVYNSTVNSIITNPSNSSMFKNILYRPGKIWNALKSTNVTGGYSNDRRIVNDSIIYLPSINILPSTILSNSNDNDLLLMALRANYNIVYESSVPKDFSPALTHEKVDELTTWLLKSTILNIEHYNKSIDLDIHKLKTIVKNITGDESMLTYNGGSLLTEYSTVIQNINNNTWDSELKIAQIKQLGDISLAELSKYKSSELSSLLYDVLSESFNNAIEKLLDSKVYFFRIYNGKDKSFRLRDEFINLFDKYFFDEELTIDSIDNLECWEKLQYLYKLSQFFKVSEAYTSEKLALAKSKVLNFAIELDKLKYNYNKLKDELIENVPAFS